MKRLNRLARARPGQARGDDPPQPALKELTLTEVGARGDGVAQGEDGPLFAPFGLPGERVRAQVLGARAEIVEILQASAERVEPPCPHFGKCGGCQLQHWALHPSLAWKRAQVSAALRKRGLEAEVAPTIDAWGAGRRRATLHAIRAGRGVRVGFIERGGARVHGVETCPALTPALQRALPELREIALRLAPPRGEATLHCLATDAGLDLDVRGGVVAQDRAQAEALAAFADRADLARLSLDSDPVVVRRTPVLAMGRARVTPPPGAFLQPSAEGEAVLAKLVCDAMAGAERVADLFCGIGTFALRLAETAEVLAVEGDAAMIAALKRAADGAGGALRDVVAERRDLLRTPIAAMELRKIDAVAFDPPRSGARLQAEQIAASKVSRAVAVSCDAGTFARDARTLVDGGFTLVSVTPVDQFRWSPHVEIVGVFTR
ncbi:MAG: RNA methyltransferase [Alphaproteobacteria bacterium]|nr:RNA methyltransferase [Alphaproteobacteria bacterium]